MNPCIPDWNFEGGLPTANLNKQIGSDHELMELLWRNGQVVMQSQTNRKSGTSNESKMVHNKHDQLCWNPNNLLQDDEMVSWLHYPLDDPMGNNEFNSNFFTEFADQVDTNKHMKQLDNERIYTKLHHSAGPALTTIPMAPPTFPVPVPPCPKNVSLGSSVGGFVNGDVREVSTMTVGSSHCGSNHIGNYVSKTSKNGVKNSSPAVVKESNNNNNNRKFVPQGPKCKPSSPDPTMASSSGGSGSSFMISADTIHTNSHKRKPSNMEESEYQSEAAELESGSAKKQSQRPGLSRKTRAAEVHNLSERRRRDRINEKMKALQELIPHSNKADKASMLDEAIEYLKSLQLQLQMMWIGNGMQPMMFPSVQHYLPRMSIPTMPSLHSVMQLPRVSATPNQTNVSPSPSPVLTPMSFQNQLQNSNLNEQYARYLAFQQMQASSQSVGMFNFGGAQSLPSHNIVHPPPTGNCPSAAGATMDNS